jgi:lysophospholipase L1-like esterase
MTNAIDRRSFVTISAAAALLGAAHTGWSEDGENRPKRPKVLLLGDSIRLSYQAIVAKKLAAKAEVVGPDENCQYSLYTLSSLDRWIQRLGKPDIVHWNNGLHDVGHNSDRNPVQIPLDMYVANLRSILQHLKATTPRVVWATITPVQLDDVVRVSSWSFRNEEIDRYNRAALKLMREQAVTVDDLHSLVLAHRHEYFSADHIHMNSAGQESCADAVAKSVARFL